MRNEGVGDMLLHGGLRDGKVVSHIPLDESLALRTGTEIEHSVRTGEYQQLRGVGMT